MTPDLQPLNPHCCPACRELLKMAKDLGQDNRQEDRAAANPQQPHQTDRYPEEPASHT